MAKIRFSEELSTAEKIALDKIKGEKNGVEAGDHAVDFCVRIKGVVRKGDDYDQTPSHKIPMMQALALFAQRMGFQRDAAIAKMVECIRAAMEGKEALEMTDAIAAAEAKIKKGLATLPKQRMNGKVTTVDMSVERLDVTADIAATRKQNS